MNNDDDIGEPGHIPITGDDHPLHEHRSLRLPPAPIRAEIFELSKIPGWGPHAIARELDIPVDVVNAVLAGYRPDKR